MCLARCCDRVLIFGPVARSGVSRVGGGHCEGGTRCLAEIFALSLSKWEHQPLIGRKGSFLQVQGYREG